MALCVIICYCAFVSSWLETISWSGVRIWFVWSLFIHTIGNLGVEPMAAHKFDEAIVDFLRVMSKDQYEAWLAPNETMHNASNYIQMWCSSICKCPNSDIFYWYVKRPIAWCDSLINPRFTLSPIGIPCCRPTYSHSLLLIVIEHYWLLVWRSGKSITRKCPCGKVGFWSGAKSQESGEDGERQPLTIQVIGVEWI